MTTHDDFLTFTRARGGEALNCAGWLETHGARVYGPDEVIEQQRITGTRVFSLGQVLEAAEIAEVGGLIDKAALAEVLEGHPATDAGPEMVTAEFCGAMADEAYREGVRHTLDRARAALAGAGIMPGTVLGDLSVDSIAGARPEQQTDAGDVFSLLRTLTAERVRPAMRALVEKIAEPGVTRRELTPLWAAFSKAQGDVHEALGLPRTAGEVPMPDGTFADDDLSERFDVLEVQTDRARDRLHAVLAEVGVLDPDAGVPRLDTLVDLIERSFDAANRGLEGLEGHRDEWERRALRATRAVIALAAFIGTDCGIADDEPTSSPIVATGSSDENR